MEIDIRKKFHNICSYLKGIFNKTYEEVELMKNDKCTIKLDSEGKVRIENLNDEDIKKIFEVNTLVMDLNNYPLSYKNRKKYSNDIKSIYTMALNDRQDEAIKYTKKLKEIMERNIELKRAIEYTVPATILFILIILFSYLKNKDFSIDIYNVCISSSLGGILSLLLQPKKFLIDYKVETYIIIIESIKRVIITLVMGTIGYIAVKANIIFSNLEIYKNKYILYLIIILCSYSSTFIPNMLDNMSNEGKNINKK